MKIKKLWCALLTVVYLNSSLLPVYANTTEQLKAAEQEKTSVENQLQNASNHLSGLTNKKKELENYLLDLNNQLSSLSKSLEEVQIQASQKGQELDRLKASLERAKEDEERQYEDMKLRIQYMYEQSGASYVEILLASEDFVDFLNKADAINEISRYDREKLKDYKKTKEMIAKKEKEVEKEKEEIDLLAQEKTKKQEEIEAVVLKTDEKITEYKSQITDAEAKTSAYLANLEKQKKNIVNLKQRAENEAAAQAEAIKLAEEAARVSQKANKEKTSQEKPSQSSGAVKEETVAISQVHQQTEPIAVETPSAQEKSVEAETGTQEGTYLGKFKLTAYCGCAKCCGTANKPTASGLMPTSGHTVAMAGVPFGTKLKINGVVYTVEDRGTPYGHADIFMDTHQQALQFGLQYADVYQVN